MNEPDLVATFPVVEIFFAFVVLWLGGLIFKL